jgi:hypothetical protein
MADKEKKLYLSANQSISIIEKSGGELDVLVNGKVNNFELKDGHQPTSADKIQFAHAEKRSLYQKFLSNHFENLVIISGAGTSVGFGGQTMLELWNAVEIKLTSSILEKLCKAIGFIDEAADYSTLKPEQKDLEKLLSKAHMAKEFIKEYKGTPLDIGNIVTTAEKVIHQQCKIKLPLISPHEQFLNKITNRKLKDPRVKLFTLNYDTLFEQAAVKGNFTLIDGFSFSQPRTLSGRNFDYDLVHREKSRIKEEDSFVPKVFHLYKPHGSINWEMNGDNIIINDNTENPLMIYPKGSKYENSYEQPFFEMMSRFQQNLRKDNVLLICIGFSFGDKHIITAIKEAVTQNPSFRLLIVTRTIRDNDIFNWFVERSKANHNITIISEEFKDFTENYPASKIYESNPQVVNKTSNGPAI